MIPEGKATEAQKKRKVTHDSGRQSDGGAKKEKGHAYFRKSKRRRHKKVERSRMVPKSKATEEQKSRKVTHGSGRQSDGVAIKEKAHYCAGIQCRRLWIAKRREVFPIDTVHSYFYNLQYRGDLLKTSRHGFCFLTFFVGRKGHHNDSAQAE